LQLFSAVSIQLHQSWLALVQLVRAGLWNPLSKNNDKLFGKPKIGFIQQATTWLWPI
jgi:hypothetical protein